MVENGMQVNLGFYLDGLQNFCLDHGQGQVAKKAANLAKEVLGLAGNPRYQSIERDDLVRRITDATSDETFKSPTNPGSIVRQYTITTFGPNAEVNDQYRQPDLAQYPEPTD